LWRYGKWSRLATVACVAAAVSLGSWRSLDENGSGVAQLGDGRMPWSEQAVADLRAAGTPVFVDVTADWCITCLANESAVLLTEDMTAAFEEYGVVYMVADWTNYDADIAALLRQHRRTGIPLYLMYPADPAAEPLLLPQILTRGTVLDALRAVSNRGAELAVN
ncbi:MAG: thioredoxin family protein, partial [Halioglobus sp.]|nr:thioredoxin family protein [Halioglobus sp.]